MNIAQNTIVVRLLVLAAAVAAVACADPTRSTNPIRGARSARDTVALEDSLLCRSGFVIQGGRAICNSDQ